MNDLEKVYENGLVVIARRVPVEKIGKCAQAILKGGCILMESTFDQTNPNCIEENKACIKEIIKVTDGKNTIEFTKKHFLSDKNIYFLKIFKQKQHKFHQNR